MSCKEKIDSKDADEEDVFEINDFTTASEWERFIASIEEVLHDWQLTSNEDYYVGSNEHCTGKEEWQEQSTEIKFSDFPFIVTYHFKTYEHNSEETKSDSFKDYQSSSRESKKDNDCPKYLDEMSKFGNDFPGRAHCLVRWYGLERFITLCPANSSLPILSASKAKILVSSLYLSANNTNCQVPLFVQVSHTVDKIYMGVGVGNGLRTDFEMAYIKAPPAQCNNLSGLLAVFKDKLGLSMAADPVYSSVRFTYIVSDWPHTSWTQQPPDLDATLSDVGFSELGKLPFGALSDPISEIQLSTTWPMLHEMSVNDTEAFSSLSPMSAPLWSARLVSAPVPPCLLSENLMEVYSCCQNENHIVQILGHDFDPLLDDGANIVNALDRLTSSAVPSLSSVVSRGKKAKKPPKAPQGPIPEDTLSLLLNFLFPDAQSLQEENASYADCSTFSQIPPWNPSVEGIQSEHPLKTVLRNMKSCGFDSFVWRLSVVVCHVVQSLGGSSAVAHLYYEILLELRFRCDNAILLPGLSDGPPDLATCLVHQQLQMLNCCIKHRIERENRVEESCEETLEDTEEEFYECEDGYSSSGSRDFTSSWDKPEGRLRKFGLVKLLQKNDFLYVPITQEAAPLTEDRLEEHTDQLLRLGTDSSGSSQRARMMSSALLSDMESFKAANSGSILEDFVRWYSPRDWIEEEIVVEDGSKSTKWSLSPRMQIQGNLWQEVWESANPVPSRRQKRLFDDTREAEKVLQWFTDLPPGKLCLELVPVVMHASLCRIAEEEVLYTLPAVESELLPNPVHSSTLSAQLEVLAQRVVRLSRQPASLSKFQMFVEQVAVIERSIAKAQSLRLKLLGHNRISEESFKQFNIETKTEISNSEKTTKVSSEKDQSDSISNISSLEKLVFKLLHLPDVALDGGPKGPQAAAIKKLFYEAKNALLLEEPLSPPEPTSKIGAQKWDFKDSLTSRDIELGKPAGREYLLRGRAAMPTYHSKEFAQRLYAVIFKNSFRFAGAITQDTVFC